MATMIKVELEEDVFERLQALAKPFVDSPSSVIRSVLDELDSIKSRSTQTPSEKREAELKERGYVTSRGVRLPFGKLRASYRRRGSDKTHTFEAQVTAKGIEFDGQVFDDPSPAGIHAKELAGAEGSATSVNGWDFWECFDPTTRRWITINVFRTRETPNINFDDLDLHL